MTYVIAEPCFNVKDQACVPACPVDCIHAEKDAAGQIIGKCLYIAPDECIDCGACVEPCPVQAIFPQDELPEKWKFYTEINAKFFTAGRKEAPAWEGFTMPAK
jgi:NAD-dependent dihydropyrimidine dehydrogenase PreA subunit